MNWGVRIVLLYVGFITLILTMVGLTMGEKHDLVTKDYYRQELNYQNRIDEENRTSSLPEQLSWELKQHQLILKFPEQFKGKTIQGTVHFFRPSDASWDVKLTLAADTLHLRSITTSQLKTGVYKLQISWEVNGEHYFNEGVLQIN